MNNKGQSLIESLVALTVLVVGVMSAVSLGIYTIRGAQSSFDDLVAMNLAQEALEGVRWLRDSNWKTGKDWKYDIIDGNNMRRGRLLVNTSLDDHPFELQDAILSSNIWSPANLCFNPYTGKYTHAPLQAQECLPPYEFSGYSRAVVIMPGVGGMGQSSLMVAVIVSKGSRHYVLVEEFYDWWP